jgi:hypothetical protein
MTSARFRVFSALLGLVLVAADPPGPNEYKPVAPPAALHAAARASIKVAQNWLDERDLASARNSAQELAVLSQLAALQSKDPAWRQKTTALQQAAGRFGAAAGAKDQAGAEKALKEYEALLADLDGLKAGEAPVDREFKTFGSTNVWMRLLDGAYQDAKSARTPQELENLALALAEEMNAAGRLRREARWQAFSRQVTETALAAAEHARKQGLQVGRVELKKVYARCEACHEGYRR